MTNQLSADAKQQLKKLVPDGYDVENARLIVCSAKLTPASEISQDETVAIAEVTQAAAPNIITDGMPTVMRVMAWMVHEGVNRNGDGFIKEELVGAASKISSRNPLVMDWNHAAIVGGAGKVIGIWTKAEYAFDQKAKDGAGAWGLLVEGVMFAWLYPEIATKMLAEQERNGAVDFSMACIAASVEFGDHEGQHVMWLHNPVFFTNSALDVRPADKDALGRVREADTADDVEAQLRTELTGATTTADIEQLATLVAAKLAASKETIQMNKLEIAASAPSAEGVITVTATVTAEGAETITQTLDITPATVTTIDEAKVTELETTAAALRADLATATTANAALQEQLDAATTRIAEIDAAAAATAKAATLAQRLTELPESYKAAHDEIADEERTQVEARWADMTAEAWAEKVADLHKAVPKTASYLLRSAREGRLATGGAPDVQSITDRVQKFTRSA